MANAATNSSGNHGNTNQMNVSAATSSSTSTVEALAMSLKNTEVISILKRRNNSSENVNDNLKYTTSLVATSGGHSPSIHSQTYSDSSLQKYDDDDEDDSDSDWDGFPVSNFTHFCNHESKLDGFLFLSFSKSGESTKWQRFRHVRYGEHIFPRNIRCSIKQVRSYLIQNCNFLIVN